MIFMIRAVSRVFSGGADCFQGLPLPEKAARLAGYSAIIDAYQLEVPLPDLICAISMKHKRYQEGIWRVFTKRHQPADNLYAHLVFALKYEGVNLWVLSALFSRVSQNEIKELIQSEINSLYNRRIWFLVEWLKGVTLDIKDIQDTKIRYVDVLDSKLQYVGPSRRSQRHRVNNNLPGVPNFCPIIRKTEVLENFIHSDLSHLVKTRLKDIHSDLILRAAAFLLLEDSKASFAIEGESPPYDRSERWGRAIGQAGLHPLSHDEFLRLQKIVIQDFRYIQPGYRNEGGFIGQHDRATQLPIPSHISARFQDLCDLMQGLIAVDELLSDSSYNAVLAATAIAFGFVFIHPFEDGNGRIHRYLIHHVLSRKRFTPEGIIFPISYVILEKINIYRIVLETYSAQRLKFIKWRPTPKNNVEILNETVDLYRYFDATKQAEFLFSCIQETIEKVLPKEIDYLQKYDEMKRFIESYLDMPDRLVNLLIVFLQQGYGKLSKRAREKEFESLTTQELEAIESKFQAIFL
ncbi:MAG: Fic family protein [Gammaproteobacteria bacterium]